MQVNVKINEEKSVTMFYHLGEWWFMKQGKAVSLGTAIASKAARLVKEKSSG